MKNLLALFALLMTLFLAACGGGAVTQPSPTAEATEAEPTEVRPTAVPTETSVPAAAGAVADVFPCNLRAVEDQGSVLRVVHRLPDPDSPIVGARRAGQSFSTTEVRMDAAGGVWYNIYEANRTTGWIGAEYVILDAACVSGGAEATAEASAEVANASTEATEEVTAEATEE